MISALNKNWFKELLALKGITQRKLSEKLSLDEGAFSRTLSGTRKLQLAEAKEMSKILDVSLVEILSHFGQSGEFTNHILVEWAIEAESLMTKLATPMEIEHEYASLVSGVYCQNRNGMTLDRSIVVFNPVSNVLCGRLSAIETVDGKMIVGVLRQNYNPKFHNIEMISNEIIENQVIKNCFNVKAIFPF
jgi:transcriptional regulator with XRE-family HTH domain